MSRSRNMEFSVALCGFTASEEKVLLSAFQLSSLRSRCYRTWEGREAPMVAIVDEDTPAAIEEWHSLKQRFPNASWPVVRIGAAEGDAGPFRDIANVFHKRPVLANRILKVLDHLVADAYQFAPKVMIQDEVTIDTLAELRDLVEQLPPAHNADANHILVIDDSESLRKMMEVALLAAGYHVDVAPNGEDGLKMALERRFDLIFVDLVLPGMNGYDVCRVLKREIRVDCPVVILTSKSSRIDRFRGSLVSADRYLTKPLAIADLKATLEQFL